MFETKFTLPKQKHYTSELACCFTIIIKTAQKDRIEATQVLLLHLSNHCAKLLIISQKKKKAA